MIYDSFSPEDTFLLARKMGEEADPGTVICLDGDLGVGKTLFSQGFAKGLGVEEYVNSPTFTILQEYDSGRLPLYHFDVYRIEDPEEMEETGFLDLIFGDGVCLVEWSQRIREQLPQHYIRVVIRKELEKGFDYRRIEVVEV